MLKGSGSSSYLLGVKKSCFDTFFAVPFRVLSQKNVSVSLELEPLRGNIFQDTLTRCLLFLLGGFFSKSLMSTSVLFGWETPGISQNDVFIGDS